MLRGFTKGGGSGTPRRPTRVTNRRPWGFVGKVSMCWPEIPGSISKERVVEARFRCVTGAGLTPRRGPSSQKDAASTGPDRVPPGTFPVIGAVEFVSITLPTVVWPLVVGLIALAQRKPIGRLIDRIR